MGGFGFIVVINVLFKNLHWVYKSNREKNPQNTKNVRLRRQDVMYSYIYMDWKREDSRELDHSL